MKYKHYFKCLECGAITSNVSNDEIYDKNSATFEAPCLCGKNQQSYLESKVIQR